MKRKKIFSPQEKVVANIENVLEFLKTENTSPVLVEFDSSNICPHNCFFCLSSHIHFKEFKESETYDQSVMSRDKMFEIADDLIEMKVKAISFTGGGESVVNPHLKDLIEYIGENSSIKIGMFTNGVLLDKFNLFKTICKHLTWIRFSIDAGTEETYNRIRVTNKSNDWNKMLFNLEKLIKTKKELNSKFVIGTGFVITEYNYKEIIDFATRFKDYEVDYCQYKPEITVVEKGGEKNRVDFWDNDVKPLLKQAKDVLGNKFQINEYKLDDLTKYPDTFGRNYKKCLGSQIQPCIEASGYVTVCPNHRGHHEYSYGNTNEKRFKEIWNDIIKRQEVMNRIDNIEQFSKCTVLCKCGESNKKFYEIYENWNSKNDEEKVVYEQKLIEESIEIKKDLEHPEFI